MGIQKSLQIIKIEQEMNQPNYNETEIRRERERDHQQPWQKQRGSFGFADSNQRALKPSN